MVRVALRTIGIAFLVAASLVLAACQGGGYTRGVFAAFVVGTTEAEIVERFGPPAAIDRADPESPVLVYKAKTFDPDNNDKTDPETRVYLVKGKEGRVVGSDVSFRG